MDVSTGESGGGGSGGRDEDVGRLTGAVASGDPDAFARFYEWRFEGMYATARRVTGRDESFCLDVVQESFMKMIRRMRRIESEAALSVWVKRVVTRTAYDMLREESRRAGREEVFERVRAAGVRGEAEGMGEAERLAWLEGEIARLGREEAELVLARHRFGWTLRTIGERFGLSPGAVDGRLARIVGAMRSRAREVDRD